MWRRKLEDLRNQPANREIDKEYRKYLDEQNNNRVKSDFLTVSRVTLGALLSAFNIAVFVNAARMLPSGINGLTLLVQRVISMYTGISLPFTLLSLVFNSLPTMLAFVVLGRKYTLLSFYCVFIYSVAVDVMPSIYITDNQLLLAVFGGLLGGLASSIILNAGACQGGTDFIAMCFTIMKGINAFNYILVANIVMVAISGVIFGIETALYTIIYQYVATQMCNYLYQRYEKKTLFIVTKYPKEVADEIRRVSNHTSTILRGEGAYSGAEMVMVYVIIGSEELSLVKKHIVDIDAGALINVISSENIEGKFYVRPYS